MIIISHSAKQGNIYERAVAAIGAGFPTTFLTGGYYKPDRQPYKLLYLLPVHRRRRIEACLARRRHIAIPARNVVQLSAAIAEPLRLVRAPYKFIDGAHDLLASWWLRSRRIAKGGVFHGFQGGCLHSLASARSKGMTTVVEITLPPVEEQNRQAEIPDYGRFTLDGADLEKQCLSEARIADFIIAQSQYTFEYLVRRGIDAGRIRIIPLGVDTEKFTPYFRGASSRRPKMLFVGQLGYRKAIWQLITRLDRTEFAQWDLDIVGETVDSVGKWCTECRFPNVHIYGRVSDEAIIDLYHRADVFVMPSLSEGGCNVVMEALACGLPCIVSDAAVSIVTHGESGYVIPRGDMIGFADGLTRLRQNADLRRTMGNRARQIAEKYSWREYRNRLAKFYSSIF